LQAERLLADLGVTEPSDIDLSAIAWHLGLEIVYRALSGCEARIVAVGDRGIISIDENKPPRRRRFSIGHEIGHWEYHRGLLLHCRSDEIGNAHRQIPDAERLANRYAAELLMPRFLFHARVAALRRLTWAAIRQLGKEFDTSPVAAAIRAVEMHVHPVILVCYSKTGRRWFVLSEALPIQCFPLQELDARSHAMTVLFGGVADERSRSFSASVWLSGRGTGALRVTEQTALCEDEVLTLLTVE
jgi:hypothetical protein